MFIQAIIIQYIHHEDVIHRICWSAPPFLFRQPVIRKLWKLQAIEHSMEHKWILFRKGAPWSRSSWPVTWTSKCSRAICVIRVLHDAIATRISLNNKVVPCSPYASEFLLQKLIRMRSGASETFDRGSWQPGTMNNLWEGWSLVDANLDKKQGTRLQVEEEANSCFSRTKHVSGGQLSVVAWRSRRCTSWKPLYSRPSLLIAACHGDRCWKPLSADFFSFWRTHLKRWSLPASLPVVPNWISRHSVCPIVSTYRPLGKDPVASPASAGRTDTRLFQSQTARRILLPAV